MTKLSVNINKVATLRNSRGGTVPDVVQVALDCERFGADGITVHPRPDERHIRHSDVHALSGKLTTEFNIEGYPSRHFLQLVLGVKPTQVTLVPDAPDALTSSVGWNTIVNRAMLTDIVKGLKQAGIRSSLFVNPDARIIEGAAIVGADRVELYTGPYAHEFAKNREAAIKPFKEAAKTALSFGLEVNAGHDLSLENLRFFIAGIPAIKEVSIGHALISDALYFGLAETIRRYKEQIALAL